MNYMTTNSGGFVDFENPEFSKFTIEDIAQGLSNTCRFAGQCDDFYSVAQHSVLVSRLVATEHRMQALLHDASEAFIHDITRPLKQMLPEYRTIETALQMEIFKRFGTPLLMHYSVKRADNIVLATEMRDLITTPPHFMIVGNNPDEKPLPFTIVPVPPKQARLAFLHAYYELTRVAVHYAS
jgi:hypothetical protein